MPGYCVKVTPKKGKATNLKATITVKNPSVKFTDAAGNTITLLDAVVGETVTLKTVSGPKTSKITYTSSDKDIATVDAEGKLVPVKAGKVVIQAKNASGATAMLTVNVHAAASVKSVEALNGVQIKVTFGQPVYTSLTSSLLTLKDANGSTVSYTGAWVDANNKTEYIMTTATAMSGTYTVELTSGVKNNTNDDFETYKTTVEVKDIVAPTIESSTYSDDGETLSVKFSEPMKGTASVVATRADGKTLTDSVTATTGADNRTFEFKLTKAGSAFVDGNTNINLTITGISDFAGNVPGNGSAIQLTANYDVAATTNATVVSVTRTGLKEVTVKFSSKIKVPGTVTVGSSLTNTASAIDATDKTIVKYTFASEITLTGVQLVTVSGWQAYKAPAATVPDIKSVDFTYSKIAAPVITKLEYVPQSATNPSAYFLATYDKDVVIDDLATAGSVSVTQKLANGDISTASTTIATNAKNTKDATATTDTASQITLASATMPSANGTYTISLPANIVKNKDGVGNAAATFTITISNFTAATTQLPAPTSVTQSGDKITIVFSKKVDVASAENVANYSIVGANVISATVTANATANATVELKVSVPTTANYVINIAGVKGYADSYAAMALYTESKRLTDTIAPTMTKAQVTAIGDGSATDTKITITFSEAVTLDADKDDAIELVVGSTTYKLTNATAITSATTGEFTVTTSAGNKVDAAVAAQILASGVVQVKAGTTTTIVDASGNAVANTVKFN